MDTLDAPLKIWGRADRTHYEPVRHNGIVVLIEVYTDEQGGRVGWLDLDHPARIGRGSYPGGDTLDDRDEMRADAMRRLVVQYSVLKEGAMSRRYCARQGCIRSRQRSPRSRQDAVA